MNGVSEHDRAFDLVPSVALGAATPQEVAEVERHAATCHICRAELDALGMTVGRIGLSVPQVTPPPSVKAKVLADIRRELTQSTAAPVMPKRRLRLWPAVTGTLAAALLAMGAWNVSLRGDDGPRVIPAAQVQAAPQLGVTATVADVDGRRVAVMRIRGLGDLPTQEGYEVWTIPASGTPVSAGFMSAGADEFLATVDVSDGETIAVTRERRTNTAAPTAEPLVAITT